MSQLAVNTITNAAGGNTAQINGMTPTADSLQGFRNRIINGDMRIDQRNAGASVTPTNLQYCVDRFLFGLSQTSKLTAQQTTVAPSGFTNSFRITSSSSYAVISSDFFFLRQPIEGFNVADLAWGTASAATVTLSFMVYSSLTGTFGGSVRNSANNRSYPFTYTVSAANTWTTAAITIPGDTSGTWLTNNGTGIDVCFGVGVGSNFSGTAGAWAGSNFVSATGSVSVVGTSGATFYITGVQLEAGSVATPFERRDYGRELMMCQRYYQQIKSRQMWGAFESTTIIQLSCATKVTMRSTPTVTRLAAVIVGTSQGAFSDNGSWVFVGSSPEGYCIAFVVAAGSVTAFGLPATADGEDRVSLTAEL
jgi:hypothetical protein